MALGLHGRDAASTRYCTPLRHAGASSSVNSPLGTSFHCPDAAQLPGVNTSFVGTRAATRAGLRLSPLVRETYSSSGRAREGMSQCP